MCILLGAVDHAFLMSLTISTTSAITKRRWIRPPKVYEVKTPKNQRTIKIPMIVHSIMKVLMNKNVDLLGSLIIPPIRKNRYKQRAGENKKSPGRARRRGSVFLAWLSRDRDLLDLDMRSIEDATTVVFRQILLDENVG